MPRATAPSICRAKCRSQLASDQLTSLRGRHLLDTAAVGYYRLVVRMLRNTLFRDFYASRRFLLAVAGLLAPAAIGSVCLRPTVLANPVAALPQSPNDTPLAFEVASIRPSSLQSPGGEGSSRSQIETAPDGLVMRNIDLSEMIQWAYSLDHDQVQAAGILSAQRYDLNAKNPDRVSESVLRRMLQDLLATRFKMRSRREQKKDRLSTRRREERPSPP